MLEKREDLQSTQAPLEELEHQGDLKPNPKRRKEIMIGKEPKPISVKQKNVKASQYYQKQIV